MLPYSAVQGGATAEIKHLKHCPNKQCGLDALPTSLLKHCSCILAPVITRIFNLSLATCDFCPQLKQSVITPLLKKPSCDTDKLSNYRPISNLSVVSKIIERIVKSRLTDHLTVNRLFNHVQSSLHIENSTLLKLFFFHFMITSSMSLVVSKLHVFVYLTSQLPSIPFYPLGSPI